MNKEDLMELNNRPDGYRRLGRAHLKALKDQLPSPEKQAKEADYLGTMFDDTKRAGSGGVKAGQVGIRPSGSITAFHERYTSPTTERKPSDPVLTESRNTSEGPAILLPRTWCGACSKNTDNAVGVDFMWFPDKDTSKMLTDVSGIPVDGPAMAAACGIRPMQGIVMFVCKTCSDISRKPGIPTVSNGQVQDSGNARALANRRQRLENVLDYIRAKRTAGDMSIYTDGRTE